MRLQRRLLLLLILGASLIAFQNCNLVVGKAQKQNTLSAKNSSGNGVPYEGKPDPGDYYRVVPGFSCNGKPAVFGKVTVTDEALWATSTNPADCMPVVNTLQFSDVETSRDRRSVLGYREGIFEHVEGQAGGGTGVETWCRGSAPDQAVDVILRASTGSASLKAWVQTSHKSAETAWSVDAEQEFQVLRDPRDGSQVKYSGETMVLNLNLDSLFGDAQETVVGHFEAVVAGALVQSPVTCRTQLRPVSACPANYVRVSPLAGYTESEICVAKYEMKSSAQSPALAPESRASGVPWVSVNRDQAVAACRSLGSGFDLIRNEEWQAMARNIESVAWNWGADQVGSAAGLSRTYAISSVVAAGPDEMPCTAVSQSCSLTTWSPSRRVHKLSTGELIWDVGGNASEWVKDDISLDYTYSVWPQVDDAMFRVLFGPAGTYSGLNREPYGGLGEVLANTVAGAATRSGNQEPGGIGNESAGIFSIKTDVAPSDKAADLGFRCVYHPQPLTRQTAYSALEEPSTAAEADSTPVEVGALIRMAKPGTITAIRFYRGAQNAAGYTVHLWTADGTLLASGSGSDGVIPGWQEIKLSQPVAVVAGQDYMISYFSSNGRTAYTHSGLRVNVSRGLEIQLRADSARYLEGSGFPTQVWVGPDSKSLYTSQFVDAVFLVP